MSRPPKDPSLKKHTKTIRIRGRDIYFLIKRYGTIQKWIDAAVRQELLRLFPVAKEVGNITIKIFQEGEEFVVLTGHKLTIDSSNGEEIKLNLKKGSE